MRLVIAGGGGFRVPQVIEVLAAARSGTGPCPGLVVDEVCLYDCSRRRLDVMRAVIADLDFPGAPLVTSTTDLRRAVRGADFVFSAIRVGGVEGRVVDERVALEQGVLGQETVGAGGCAYALRTIPVVMELARAVREAAPQAWVINFTNPAGIITQAMRTVLGRRVVGICDTPIGLVRRAAAALGVGPGEAGSPDGPGGAGGAGARGGLGAPGGWGGEVSFDYVGLNHLGWLRSLEVGGRDVLPELLGDDARLEAMEEARALGPEWVRALGMLPNEYLFYYYLNREAVDRIRREELTRGEFLVRQQREFYEAAAGVPGRAGALWSRVRAEREATYMAESRDAVQRLGRREADLVGGGYQQVALDLMTAVATGAPSRMILNVANDDAHRIDGGGLLVPQLREDAVVEVPCVVDGRGVRPQRVAPLGGAELGLVAAVKGCEELIIEAALHGDASLAWRALAGHPLVDSVRVAGRILEGYMREHPQVGRLLGR